MTDSNISAPFSSPTLLSACAKAIEYRDAGQLQAAETVFRAVLQAEPRHPLANHQLGLLHMQMGQPEQAAPYLLAALEGEPETAEHWFFYLEALIQTGKINDAREILSLGQSHGLAGQAVDALVARLSEPAVEKTVQAPAASVKKSSKKQTRPSSKDESAVIALLDEGRFDEGIALAGAMTERFPQHGFGWKILAALLRSQGESEKALICAQKAAQLLPKDAEAQTNFGLVLGDLKRFKEATVAHRRALKLEPRFAEAYNNLGNALKMQGHLLEAEASYRKALALNSNNAKAYNNLGVTLYDQRRLAEAEAAYAQSLKINPVSAEACNNMGNSLRWQGRLIEAECFLRQALTYQPEFVDAHYNLGCVLRSLKRGNEAVVFFRQALAFNPNLLDAQLNLGAALSDLGFLNEAEFWYRSALLIDPTKSEAYNNLGFLLMQKGLSEEAEQNYRFGLELKPDDAEMFSNMLFALSHMPNVDKNRLFAEHCNFAERFESQVRSLWPAHSNNRDSDRCLQIGFVSADLCNHAIANFIRPVLFHLANYPSLCLHAYYTNVFEDDITQRIKVLVRHWHSVGLLSESALAEKIQADGIDILIDLSSHTSGNRLLTFARKPAPVQASWMGYPGTTGLRAMDYYFADRYFLPPGQFDDQFTEKLAYLPASAPFLPFESAPSVSDLPALNVGYLTFGSFNRPSKLSAPTIALWSQLLRALPESRMLLGAMAQEGEHDKLIDDFAQEGIARERLSFFPRSNMLSYLTLHRQVDICLDTYPYAGGTTTFHALWMGVPTLTVTGSTPAGRSGASILTHVGLDVFVAKDAADFVRKGKFWASNLCELAELRSGLRTRCEQSNSRNPSLIAASFERALRIMWQRWCSGLPAESFEVLSQDVNSAQGGAE